MVFAVEAALGLPGGSLSQHLGYLPAGPSGAFEAALHADPLLAEPEKLAILTIYRRLTSEAAAGRSSSSRAASKPKRATRK
jgi:hypothetical protein